MFDLKQEYVGLFGCTVERLEDVSESIKIIVMDGAIRAD